MIRYLLRRIGLGVISIVGASMVIFVISRLSGDPIVLLLPVDAPPAVIEEMRRSMGLDHLAPPAAETTDDLCDMARCSLERR